MYQASDRGEELIDVSDHTEKTRESIAIQGKNSPRTQKNVL